MHGCVFVLFFSFLERKIKLKFFLVAKNNIEPDQSVLTFYQSHLHRPPDILKKFKQADAVKCVCLTASALCLVSAARMGLLSEQQQRLLLQHHQLQQLLSSQPSVVRHTQTHTCTHSRGTCDYSPLSHTVKHTQRH